MIWVAEHRLLAHPDHHLPLQSESLSTQVIVADDLGRRAINKRDSHGKTAEHRLLAHPDHHLPLQPESLETYRPLLQLGAPGVNAQPWRTIPFSHVSCRSESSNKSL